MTNISGSMFDLCMGFSHEVTEVEIEAEQTVCDAQEALEELLTHIIKTNFKDDLHVKLALSSIIEAWKRVLKVRKDVGY